MTVATARETVTAASTCSADRVGPAAAITSVSWLFVVHARMMPTTLSAAPTYMSCTARVTDVGRSTGAAAPA